MAVESQGLGGKLPLHTSGELLGEMAQSAAGRARRRIREFVERF
jgi:hypothetical protein